MYPCVCLEVKQLMVLGIKLGLPDLASGNFTHLTILPTYKSYFNRYINWGVCETLYYTNWTDFDAGGVHSLLYIVHFEEKVLLSALWKKFILKFTTFLLDTQYIISKSYQGL